MIRIRTYGKDYTVVGIALADNFLPGIEPPSSKIEAIKYIVERKKRGYEYEETGWLIPQPRMKIEMSDKIYSMDSAYDVDAFIATFNTLDALEALK